MIRVNTKDGKFHILKGTVQECSNQIARAYVKIGGLPAFLEFDNTIIVFRQIVSIESYTEGPEQEEEINLFNWNTEGMGLGHGH